jgi:prevent-host-death family protein
MLAREGAVADQSDSCWSKKLVRYDERGEVIVTRWPVQDAKARFSELLDTALREGPQIVTRRGIEAAVLVPIDDWRRLRKLAAPNIKELLLGPGPRFEGLVKRRQQVRRRPPVMFG